MPRAIGIAIGNQEFPSINSALRYIQTIWRHHLGKPRIEGEDAKFVDALFKMHPQYIEKTEGRAIAYYFVGKAKGGSICFYIAFEKGPPEDFSAKKILRNHAGNN